MKSKPTLKQIAKELGVSVSTVSKALNNSLEISEPTKIRIQEYAKLQNYKPNSMALNLKSQKTNTIGVVIPNILNPFFAKVFTGIEKVANAKGYNLITYISNESLLKEKQALDLLSNGTVDGFILSVSEESQKLKEYKHFKNVIQEGYPIVMFDRISDDVHCDKVVVDDFDSAYDATNHLIKIGCKKIALLSCIDNLSVGKLRAKGYIKAIDESNLNMDENIIIATDDNDVFDTKLRLLLDSQKIDGVFALDEHASTMALKMSLKKGISIPDDLCIVGFADGVWSRRMNPSLSTVSQHAPEIGEVAAKLLIQKLESKEEIYNYTTKVIKTELRQRESTRKL